MQSRIKFIQRQEESTLRKALSLERKLSSLHKVRLQARQHRETLISGRCRTQQDQLQNAERSAQVRQALKQSRETAAVSVSRKAQEQSSSLRDVLTALARRKQQELRALHERNAEKVSRLRQARIQGQARRRAWIEEKLEQARVSRKGRVRQEEHQEVRHRSVVVELELAEKALRERLSMSEVYRSHCRQMEQRALQEYVLLCRQGTRSFTCPHDNRDSRHHN